MASWTRFLSILTVVLFLLGAAALSQPPEGRPPGPGGLERALDELKLNPQDRDKALEVLRAHHDKMRKANDQAREDFLKQMKDILSEEQLKHLKEAMERRPPQPPPPPGPGGRGPRGVPADDLVERVMKHDKNGDGKVTREELPERMHQLIEQGDANKDGALDKEELKKLAAKLGQEGPPRGPRGPGGPPPGPPGGLERTLEELKLSDKQKLRVDEVFQAHRDKMHKLFEQGREDLLKQMREAIGAEQQKQFEKALENQRPGGRDGPPPPPPPGGPGGPGPLERILDELKLTDKQKNKAEDILQAHHDQIRKAMEEARRKLLKEMKEVLSPEQLEQLEKALERQRPGGRDGPPPPPRPRED